MYIIKILPSCKLLWAYMGWDGRVALYIGSQEILEKKFDYPTFAELVKAVEVYVESLRTEIKSTLIEALKKHLPCQP